MAGDVRDGAATLGGSPAALARHAVRTVGWQGMQGWQVVSSQQQSLQVHSTAKHTPTSGATRGDGFMDARILRHPAAAAGAAPWVHTNTVNHAHT